MEPTIDRTTLPAQQPAPAANAEQRKPKVLSVSQPQPAQPVSFQPALSKPRVLAQIKATNPPAIATTAPQLTSPPAPAGQTGGDPKAEADWAEQTLSQAERDAEEQRMANDIAQAFATTGIPASEAQAEKPQDGQNTPKTEPKSVPGVLYAVKGLVDSISRKIAGK